MAQQDSSFITHNQRSMRRADSKILNGRLTGRVQPGGQFPDLGILKRVEIGELTISVSPCARSERWVWSAEVRSRKTPPDALV